ncbi:hypothetical protein, partial [Leuconostoc mesenteroides]|uniref:hypothetical protein n=1 Tax=Leuconostoc mesenteroides TaxID=1245 RepID=UPI00236167C0
SLVQQRKNQSCQSKNKSCLISSALDKKYSELLTYEHLFLLLSVYHHSYQRYPLLPTTHSN